MEICEDIRHTEGMKELYTFCLQSESTATLAVLLLNYGVFIPKPVKAELVIERVLSFTISFPVFPSIIVKVLEFKS